MRALSPRPRGRHKRRTRPATQYPLSSIRSTTVQWLTGIDALSYGLAVGGVECGQLHGDLWPHFAHKAS